MIKLEIGDSLLAVGHSSSITLTPTQLPSPLACPASYHAPSRLASHAPSRLARLPACRVSGKTAAQNKGICAGRCLVTRPAQSRYQ
jgi:hypothetical protein